MERGSHKETSERDGSYRDENDEVCYGVTRKDKIRNEYIRSTIKVEWLGMKMREGKLRWYRHVMRRDQEYVGRKMMEMEVLGKCERKTKEKIFRCSERR